MNRLLPALLSCLAGAAGCAQRAAPYHFRAPVVSSVSAGQPPRARDDSDDGWEAPPGRRSPSSATPAPFRPPPPRDVPATGGPLAETLRSMVGLREKEATPVRFVLDALATIGADVDSSLRDAADGPALLSMAQDRHASDADHHPLLGDLVVFDDVLPHQSASALGVVVGSRPDGTVEFVYLGRGVVRRGWLNLRHPSDKRDEHGRVLNTIIRQKRGDGKKGKGDLTGQLFATFIRLDGLAPR